MYTDAGHIVDTLIHILNAEQEFFREYVRVYDTAAAEKPKPLTIAKGFLQTRAHSSMPLLEVEPTSEANRWATTRAQRPRFSVELKLSVINSNPDYGVEYVTGWVRRVKVILCDPRRLQSRVVNRDGKNQCKWDLNEGLLPLHFMDSLIENVSYNVLQHGTIRQASMDWYCEVHEGFPGRAFTIPHNPTPGNY